MPVWRDTYCLASSTRRVPDATSPSPAGAPSRASPATWSRSIRLRPRPWVLPVGGAARLGCRTVDGRPTPRRATPGGDGPRRVRQSRRTRRGVTRRVRRRRGQHLHAVHDPGTSCVLWGNWPVSCAPADDCASLNRDCPPIRRSPPGSTGSPTAETHLRRLPLRPPDRRQNHRRRIPDPHSRNLIPPRPETPSYLYLGVAEPSGATDHDDG